MHFVCRCGNWSLILGGIILLEHVYNGVLRRVFESQRKRVIVGDITLYNEEPHTLHYSPMYIGLIRSNWMRFWVA